MDKFIRKVTDLVEQRAETYRYWRSRSSSERFEETWRLSVEAYGMPQGSLRDGPFRLIRRTPDGKEEVIREWRGPNPLRNAIANDSESSK